MKGQRFAWSLKGSTIVRLASVDHAILHDLLVDSWRRLVPKKVAAASNAAAPSQYTATLAMLA